MKRKNHFMKLVPIIGTMMILFLAGCNPFDGTSASPDDLAATEESIPQSTPEVAEVLSTELPAEATKLPDPTEIPATGTAEPTILPENLQHPEPQVIEFESEDGIALHGMYYPAAVNPAPSIVLMHWAPGDQTDWIEIAYWLQNRGLGGENANSAIPWLDSTWFPNMIADQSFAVFTFTFRNCENGCFNPDYAELLMDAQAAMRMLRALEGINPSQIATIGASIGADGGADSCFWYNDQYDHGCVGALSLSPGSYLGVPFAEAVVTLEDQSPPKPAWCFYGVVDTISSITCQAITGNLYQMFEWEGSPHGMELIDPTLEPNAMEKILDFLHLVFELDE